MKPPIKGREYIDTSDKRVWTVKKVHDLHNVEMRCSDGSKWLACFKEGCEQYDVGKLRDMTFKDYFLRALYSIKA